MTIVFVTGNAEKFANARAICHKYGLEIEQVVADIDEIQGEESERIARDKAHRAYELVGKPVVISDDSWSISALNGFPGPYMKSVSHWFTPQNFIDLVQNTQDRSVTLHQYLVYKDQVETVIFQHDHSGKIVVSPRGNSKTAWHNVVSMDADNGKTLGEVIEAGLLNDPERSERQGDAWYSLLQWLKEKQQA